jgi:predicted molibdopterin-dependent oxidoreductase YjgC
MILEFLMPLAPTGPVKALAEKYGVKKSRFKAEETSCILCGLCVRYCAEVKKANAIGFIGRGIDRTVSFLPGVAPQVCDDCRECFPLCPGGKVVKDTDGVWFQEPAWRTKH